MFEIKEFSFEQSKKSSSAADLESNKEILKYNYSVN